MYKNHYWYDNGLHLYFVIYGKFWKYKTGNLARSKSVLFLMSVSARLHNSLLYSYQHHCVNFFFVLLVIDVSLYKHSR